MIISGLKYKRAPKQLNLSAGAVTNLRTMETPEIHYKDEQTSIQ